MKRLSLTQLAALVFGLSVLAALALGQVLEAGYDRSVLTGVPCQAPCWNGIVPGDPMTLAQAATKVRGTAGVASIWSPVPTTVSWYWTQPPWETRTAASSISVLSDVVTSIDLAFLAFVTVDDIVNRYGPPDSIYHGTAGLPEHPYYRLVMYYPTRGYNFSVRVETYAQPVLDGGSRVTGAVYYRKFASAEAELEQHPNPFRVPWPGYGPLPRRVSPGT